MERGVNKLLTRPDWRLQELDERGAIAVTLSQSEKEDAERLRYPHVQMAAPDRLQVRMFGEDRYLLLGYSRVCQNRFGPAEFYGWIVESGVSPQHSLQPGKCDATDPRLILNKVILGKGRTVDYENQAELPSSTPKSSSLDNHVRPGADYRLLKAFKNFSAVSLQKFHY